MPTKSWIFGTRALAAACLLVCLDSYAQTPATPLLDTVHTVAAATTGVPVEETLNITTAGTYQVTLTDIGAQLNAPLASVKLGISSGSTLVALTAVSGSTVTNNGLIGAGSATFSAQPGTYIIHVVGAPSTTTNSNGNTVPKPNSGPFAIAVTNTSGGAVAGSFSGLLNFPPGAQVLNNVGSLSDTFTVTTAGSYQVTLTDMQFPTALTTLLLAVATPGSSTFVADLSTSSGTPTATTTVTLQPGTYEVIAGGQAAGAVNAGLYGVSVVPAGATTPLYSNTVPVGDVVSVGTPALTAAPYTLTLADLGFPNALSEAGAAVTLNGQSVAQLTATGSAPFTATATNYQVFAVGIPAASSQGAYTVELLPTGGSPVLSLARAVSDPASGVYAYSYDATVVGSETYSVDLADFGYPAQFAALKANAVQSGALLSSNGNTNGLTAAGSLSITPAAGTVTLLVFAQPAQATSSSTNTGGLFGIDLTASGAGTPAFQTSQGVGQVFSVQKVTVTTGGSYQVVVNDLGFPATFANLAVIITRGTSKIGSIFGGGTLPFTATGGDYLINFVATPGGTDAAGTYSMLVDLQPTVSLASSASSVSSGGTVSLTWSTQNVTSCTASSSPAGAWSGSEPTGGSATSAALTATTAFTLTCVAADGSANPTQTVTVTVPTTTPTPSKSGGGEIRWDVIALLLGVLGLRVCTGTGRLQRVGSRRS